MTEIALIIGVAGLVFIGMQVYFKRGLQGKVKDLADQLISPSQKAYQQDMSGYEVNNSISSVSMGAQSTATEARGGSRSLIGYENTNTVYTYESQQR